MKIKQRDAKVNEYSHLPDEKDNKYPVYIKMKYLVFLLNIIFLFFGCRPSSNISYEVKSRKFGDTIVIDSIINKKIVSRTAYLNENIYIYINFEKQLKFFYDKGEIIKKNDIEKNFEFRYYTNGKIKSILKKDSFYRVYYYNEYDSLSNNIIDKYRDIKGEDTLLNKNTLLCIPKIHTKFDNIENYKITIHYDSSYKIDKKNSIIIKTKDGYKLYCKSKCNFITKVCDSLGCYSIPLELKLH